MGKISEAARERETFRYDPSLLVESKINDAPDFLDSASLKGSSDAGLTAFAQLGVLRLGGARCLISLFDQKYEHIVAEATRSTPIAWGDHDNNSSSAADSLWLSGTAIPRKDSVCEHILLGSHEAPSGSADLPVSIIADITTDLRFKGWTYARDPPLRSLAAVPIRSQRGINIGVYSVFSSAPCDSLDPASIRFLQDISRTVMEYLQSKTASRFYQRNARMVSGLGSLVEGKSSMARPKMNHPSTIDSAATTGSLNHTEQSLQRQQDQEEERREEIQEEEDRITEQMQRRSAASLKTNGEQRGSIDSESDFRKSSITNMSNPSLGATSSATTMTHVDDSVVEIRTLFSRAAEIIRDSIEVDGVLFLDAAIGTYGGLVVDMGMEARSSDDSQASQSSSGEDGKKPALSERTNAFCKVLGLSSSETASQGPKRDTSPHRVVPENFLKSLLRRYAGGHTFTFDDSGTIQSADSEEEIAAAGLSSAGGASQAGDVHVKRIKRRQPRQSDGEVLQSICTHARNIALIPLWDSHKERWFAGGFIWTETPNRVFTRDELSYLTAFGTAMMANVARIEMMRADRGKTDVLGSLSHELRTPLHGIILGAELLHDTPLSAFQDDVIHTIETCGRTLIDTMEHLLDFSKINHFIKSSRNRRAIGPRGDRSTAFAAEMTSLVSDISIDAVVEEVIESVYAGFSFQQSPDANWKTARQDDMAYADDSRALDGFGNGAKGQFRSPSVSVYFDIDPDLSWNFRTQPGAIRRIIMNLFGNALKYTAQGSIQISLTQETVPEGKNTRRRAVAFCISDSGKGMSTDFLRNRLFAPFAQEDQLAPGVGLGLSLVKQITTTLNGSIGLDSQVGRGTTVKVVLPLSQSISSASSTEHNKETPFAVQVRSLKRLKIRLLGFRDADDVNRPITFHTKQQHPTPRALMERMCRSWLHLDVLTDDEGETASPSFYLCTEEALGQAPIPKAGDSTSVPVIVICRDAIAAHELAASYSSDPSNIYEFISQPCGPRKLAKVLALARNRRLETQVTLDKHIGPPTSTPSPPVQVASPPVPLRPKEPLESRPTQQQEPDVAKDTVEVDLRESLLGSSNNPSDSGSSEEDKRLAFLLVDDNSINLQILVSYIKKLGQQYDTAMNGQEALQLFQQNPRKYRCIFMDISMPVMDGLEATRLIRAFERQEAMNPPVFVIALTGLASSQTQQEAFGSGVDLFLTKPVRLKELGRILQDNNL